MTLNKQGAILSNQIVSLGLALVIGAPVSSGRSGFYRGWALYGAGSVFKEPHDMWFVG